LINEVIFIFIEHGTSTTFWFYFDQWFILIYYEMCKLLVSSTVWLIVSYIK